MMGKFFWDLFYGHQLMYFLWYKLIMSIFSDLINRVFNDDVQNGECYVKAQ